jgi:soluble lytic murein transglycosylase
MGRRIWCASFAFVLLLAPVAAGVPTEDPIPALRGARVAWDAGEHQEALAELEPLRNGPLADHVEFLRAGLLREQGKASEALEALEAALGVEPPSELAARIYQARSEVYLSQNSLVEAYRAAKSAWESTRDKEFSAAMVVELARAFEKRSLPGDALRLYRDAWRLWPLADSSEEAYERSLYLMEATAAPRAPANLHLRRADRLRDAYRCEPALPIYDRVLAEEAPDAPIHARAERGRADCLFQRQRYREAAVAYQRVVRRQPRNLDPAIRVARSHARAGDRDRAIALLDRLARRSSETELARIRYLMGILLWNSDTEKATRLVRAVERQRAAPGLARIARWRLAWAQLQGGDRAGAIRRLKRLTRGSKWDVEVQRARYWTAVARLEGEPEAAEAGLRKLVDEVPLSYYGLLSAQRLGIEPQLERSFIGERDADPRFPRAERARWLIEGEFPEAAGAELDSWRRESRLSRSERMAAAPLLHEIGNHYRAVRLLIDGFGGSLEEGIDPEWRDAWLHAWPRVYGGSVKAATEEFAFDPALVYAVMREESTYRPAVSSPVGARGLMQIIPPTAQRIAGWLGIEDFETDALYIPETNIRFGTYYLNHLLRRFDGSRTHAIAAYNAGPEAVSDWVARDGLQPEDAFVDSVPYGETRRYLRRVLRSYHVYRHLYAAGVKAPETGGASAQPGAAEDR